MDLSRPFKDPKGRKQTDSLMAKKNYKQFLLVIDWMHPMPEGNDKGFGYEFFDTVPELKRRAEELWKVREESEEAGGERKPGVPYLMEAYKFVDYKSSKKAGLTSAAYERIARLNGIGRWNNNERGWIVKEWCYPDEWYRAVTGGDELELVYNYGHEEEAYAWTWFEWKTYRQIRDEINARFEARNIARFNRRHAC